MSDQAKAYAINANEDVLVHLDDSSEDEKFDIVVKNEQGEELEAHSGVTVDSLGDLGSSHFSVEYIEPPTPEPDSDEINPE